MSRMNIDIKGVCYGAAGQSVNGLQGVWFTDASLIKKSSDLIVYFRLIPAKCHADDVTGDLNVTGEFMLRNGNETLWEYKGKK